MEPIAYDDGSALGVVRAVAKHNCRLTMEAQADRVSHFTRRVAERRMSADEVVIVLLNVDDPVGRELADALMPGHDWQQYRDKGKVPFARGLAGRPGIQDALGTIDIEAAAKLRALDGLAVVVVDHGVAEVFPCAGPPSRKWRHAVGDTTPTPFGVLLRDRMAKAHMSQRYLADLLHVSHVTIGEVVRGKRPALHGRHWPVLVDVLRHTGGEVTLAELQRADEMSRPVTLSPEATKELRALLDLIGEEAKARPNRAWMFDVIGQAQRFRKATVTS